MLPFTREQFFDVFAAYNRTLWPVQVGLLALAIAMIAWSLRHHLARWPGWALAGLWVWAGVAYHAAFFTAINPLAYAFAAAFVVEGVLLARATYARGLRFMMPRDLTSRIVGGVLMGYALVGYPLVALATGQSYPAMPTFGVPCPMVIFTFGLLAWSTRATWTILVIPVAWALIGISAATQLGVPEDWGLPVAALALMALRVRHVWALKDRHSRAPATSHSVARH